MTWVELSGTRATKCTLRAKQLHSNVNHGIIEDARRSPFVRDLILKSFYFEHPHPLLVEILWGWALQDTLGFGPPGDFAAGHSRETLGFGSSRDSGVGHARDTLELGTPGVDRARRRVPDEEKSSGRGEELSLKCNNPTPRVGEKKTSCRPGPHLRAEPSQVELEDAVMSKIYGGNTHLNHSFRIFTTKVATNYALRHRRLSSLLLRHNTSGLSVRSRCHVQDCMHLSNSVFTS